MRKSVLIVEDEKLNADRLQRLLHTLRPHYSIAAVLESVSDAVAWLTENEQPDVILMDVRLSDGTSFEIFDKTEITAHIIFTTAYDEYAVRAFKYNSIDYLIKPVEELELLKALDKLEKQHVSAYGQQVENLLHYLKPKDYRKRFLIPYKDEYKTVLVQQVKLFYSEFKMTHARLLNKTEVVIPYTLEELEHELDPNIFFRANRKFIINKEHVAHIYNHFNGKLKVVMDDTEETDILVSREKATALKSWMDY